ncbi:hypothetical protein EBZ70_02990 [bacterium]|jgi:tetratricopeptide (TPR) repeat protein|nr:hypothetical protein [bacterium]
MRAFRLLAVALLLLGLTWTARAATFSAEAKVALERARAAEARFALAEALELYREADRLAPGNSVILQKIAQQLSDLSLDAASDAERKTQAEQALAYARRAVELAPENAVNVLSLAICYGKMGIYGDTRAKIGYSRLVKIEAERAAALDPNYDWAQHVLGRWHYEVADLGVAKRFFVRLIYGGLPAASFEEAIRRLERAVALAPNRVPHHLELGFAFLAAGRVADARASFARGLALPSTELYDESSKQRAREALARF